MKSAHGTYHPLVPEHQHVSPVAPQIQVGELDRGYTYAKKIPALRAGGLPENSATVPKLAGAPRQNLQMVPKGQTFPIDGGGNDSCACRSCVRHVIAHGMSRARYIHRA